MATARVSVDVQYQIREEVLDKISKIDPYNRPILASIGRRNVKNTYVQWTTQELAEPSSSNAEVHGFTTTFAAADSTKRGQANNYTQLIAKKVAVDLSMEAVDVAGLGVGNELKEQKSLKFTEMLNDVEASAISANTAVQPLPNSSQAGVMAGIQTFVTNNAIVAGSGTYPSYITPDMYDDLAVLVKKDGGMPNKTFSGLQCLRQISGWVTQTTREIGNDGRRMTNIIEQYRGVAGLQDLIYHSQLTTVLLMLETGRFEMGWLREPKWHPYPDGIYDYSGGTYKTECTLISLQQKASGKITSLGYTA